MILQAGKLPSNVHSVLIASNDSNLTSLST